MANRTAFISEPCKAGSNDGQTYEGSVVNQQNATVRSFCSILASGQCTLVHLIHDAEIRTLILPRPADSEVQSARRNQHPKKIHALKINRYIRPHRDRVAADHAQDILQNHHP